MKLAEVGYFVVQALLLGMSLQSEVSCQTYALPVAAPNGIAGPNKFDNGLQIFWRSTPFPGDSNRAYTTYPEARIQIFDAALNRLVTVQTAAAVRAIDPAMTGLFIWDVSARKPGFIAVSLVSTRQGQVPCALLLYFNWDGSLLRNVKLPDSEELRFVHVNDAADVWALNAFDHDNPSNFVFAHFDKAGSLTQQLVRSKQKVVDGRRPFYWWADLFWFEWYEPMGMVA